MIGKPTEFWFSVIGGALYVYLKHKDQPLVHRILMVVLSTFVGLSIAEDVGRWAGTSEMFTTLICITVGYLVLDFASALFSDTAYLKSLLKGKIGE